MSKPKVAFIGTGGTIASLGRGPLDIQDYGSAGNPVMHAEEILASGKADASAWGESVISLALTTAAVQAAGR